MANWCNFENKQGNHPIKTRRVISLVHNFDYKLNCGRVRSCKVIRQGNGT